MERHKIRQENKDELIASRNECVFPSFASRILSGVTIDPMDLCQYASASVTLDLLATALNTSPDNITINNGSECTIRTLIETLRAEEFVITNPTFEMIPFYCDHYGCSTEVVDYIFDKTFDISFDGIDNKKDKILFIVSPNNPTGVEVDLEQLCSDFKYVIVDQAYRNPMIELPQYDNIIVIRSFSKMGLLTGMRFGFCYTPDIKLINRFNMTRPIYNPSITMKMVNYIIEHELTNELESYITHEVIPRFKNLLGPNIVHFCGNFVLVRNINNFNGHKLKKYTFVNEVFYRLTLHELSNE